MSPAARALALAADIVNQLPECPWALTAVHDEDEVVLNIYADPISWDTTARALKLGTVYDRQPGRYLTFRRGLLVISFERKQP